MSSTPHVPALNVEVFLPREVALALRCSLRSVYRLIESRQLAAIRVGRKVVIPRKALDEFLNAPLARNGDAAPAEGAK